MIEKFILDDNGNPVPEPNLTKWSSWMQSCSRQIGLNYIGVSMVSTVFLGLDHNFAGGAPILFETMIFGGPNDGFQERYFTRQEAIDGHDRAADLVRSGKLIEAE